MTKNQDDLSVISLDLDIKIQQYTLSQLEIDDFLIYVKEQKTQDPQARISLVEYCQKTIYPTTGLDINKTIIVPSLAGVAFGSAIQYSHNDIKTKFRNIEEIEQLRNGYLNLAGIDFSGVNMSKASFHGCDLGQAQFCDVDLTNVIFQDCYLAGVDMRGADLSGCKIEDNIDLVNMIDDDLESLDLIRHYNKNRYQGMQFSSLQPLFYQYMDKNKSLVEHAADKFQQDIQAKSDGIQQKITRNNIELNNQYSQLGYTEWVLGNNPEYNQLKSDKYNLEQQLIKTQNLKFDTDFDKTEIKYVIHPSIVDIAVVTDVQAESMLRFDPAYKRGSNTQEKLQPKQYVRLTRQDAQAYLALIKNSPTLSINEFAQTQLESKNIALTPGAKIVADFSTYIENKVGVSNYGIQTDLSGLDFSNANLDEACFAGTNLSNCQFNGTSMNFATFEGANLSMTHFTAVQGQDTNIFATNLTKATFTNCDLSRAYMRHSEAIGANILETKFCFADIRDANWPETKVVNTDFQSANLEGIVLANADFKRVQLQKANLNKAIMNGMQLIDSDLSGALLTHAEAQRVKIQNSILLGIDAQAINLSESLIDKFTKCENMNLENAILNAVIADEVNFINVNMANIEAQSLSARNAFLQQVNLKFANLENAVIEGAKANGIDMTSANLNRINARKVEMSNAILQDIKAYQADFSEAFMEGVTLRGAKLKQAIMEQVNLKKADLRNAQLVDTNLKNIQSDGAIINAGTDTHGSDITGSGQNTHIMENANGIKTPIPLQTQHELDQSIYAAQQKGTVRNIIGGVCTRIGSFLNHAGTIIKSPFNTTWGKKIAVATGIASGATLAAGIAFPMGISLPIVLGIAGISGLVGGVTAHFGAKHIGLSHCSGAATGMMMAGPAGAALGLAATTTINAGLKQVVGHSLDEIVGQGFHAAGNGLAAVGATVGTTAATLEAMKNREISNAAYAQSQQNLSVSSNRPALSHNAPSTSHSHTVNKTQELLPTAAQSQAHIINKVIPSDLTLLATIKDKIQNQQSSTSSNKNPNNQTTIPTTVKNFTSTRPASLGRH